MRDTKKIFTRMCLNNWGGIRHTVLKFHEYVNLFSGKSGSGKSTVMDAMQVILYGSFSSTFLNKAADDAKNKRSVLSYLRGEQKDGTANRGDRDFCSVLALEIEDKAAKTCCCVGVAFEVRRTDADIRKAAFFSHAGKMPEDGYVKEEGYCYTMTDIRRLTEERAGQTDLRFRGDINRIYGSKEAYLATLYDVILGYIDPGRFMTMQKSAIALKMTNGTGQFIRDYMFPKSASDTIGTISEQLDAYRQIKEKIEDLRKRIELLQTIRDAGQALVQVQTESIHTEAVIRCIEIEDLKARIQAAEEDCKALEEQQQKLLKTAGGLKDEREKTQEDLIRVSADLKASDLGSKQQQLSELTKTSCLLAEDARQWQIICTHLAVWEEDEIITDYISNTALNLIDEVREGKVTEELCQKLHMQLEHDKQEIERELESTAAEQRNVSGELNELKKLVEDIKNNRKSYSDALRQARAALADKLKDRYGHPVKVQVLADLFDVQDEEWKHAIEGRMGRTKLALVTEPQYAHEAAVIFKDMKQFEQVDLINTKAIMDSQPKVMKHSVYEAVSTEEAYVDACLKRYLGRIIKCYSVDELEQVRDGVMPDCYSYSNFMFGHLRKKDYTRNACIGRKVSRARLAEYEEEMKELSDELAELTSTVEGLKLQREFECLKGDPSYYVRLAGADEELHTVNKKKQQLEETIQKLKSGKYKELEEKEQLLQARMKELQSALDDNQQQFMEKKSHQDKLTGENVARRAVLEQQLEGYEPNEQLENEVWEAMKHRSGNAIKAQKNRELDALKEQEQTKTEELRIARNNYLFTYPSGKFNGAEKTNEPYEKQLEIYEKDYEPKYEKEFADQCDFIYRSLRDNVIATIHGDIKAAKRHAREINRLLKETNFSDSTYQIKIEPAKNENAQFYEMLMAEELDSKNLDNGGFDGQMSFGEDSFYQKYEQKIQLLTEKFMPPQEQDEHLRAKKRKEMEQYADYRNYLSFRMYEEVTDEAGHVIRENFVDDMAGRDSGGEGQNPKYVALLAGFAMLYMQQSARDSKIRLVLLDEAFSKMDQERSAVCLKYARKMDLQLIVCVPDERLQSLIRNVDCVYGFRRWKNQISLMHIDKGEYLEMLEGE